LQEYLFNRLENYINLNPKVAFGVDFLKPNTVATFLGKIRDSLDQYKRYTIMRMGFSESLLEFEGKKEDFPLITHFLKLYTHQDYTYGLMNYFYEDSPETCLPIKK
jgi:hypothetical protein